MTAKVIPLRRGTPARPQTFDEWIAEMDEMQRQTDALLDVLQGRAEVRRKERRHMTPLVGGGEVAPFPAS